MELFLFCINLFLMFYGIGCTYSKVNILKVTMQSIAFSFFVYSVISGFFFLIDQFTFKKVLLVQILVTILMDVVIVSLAGRRIPIFSQKVCKKEIVIILLVILILPLTIKKYELFSTQRDEGLYQAEAIELYMGNYEVQHDFEEYSILTNETDKEVYRNMVDKVFLGYYPLSLREWPTVSSEQITSDVSGMYHGIQTFPAVLALWGRMFGLEKMISVQTIFLICSIVLTYYAIYELLQDYKYALVGAIFIAFSPLILWLSKTSFTEMYLTMMIASYLLVLAERKNRFIWFMSIPLLAFSFVHVSFLMILPAFVGCHIILYLKTENKQYLLVNNITAMGVAVGYYTMSIIAPQYFFDNCSRIYVGNVITANNLMLWIIFGCICIILISFFCSKYLKFFLSWLESDITKVLLKYFFASILVLILLYGIYIAILGDASIHGERARYYTYYGEGIKAFQHLSIYAYAMATGFLIMPFILVHSIFNIEKYFQNYKYLAIFMLFSYCVIIQSATLRKEVPFYFYYSRYLAFYIPIICIIGAIVLKQYNKKVLIFTGSISSVAMLLFSIPIALNKNETFIEWETLLDLKDAVEENSAIILESDELASIIGPQLRAVTNSAIFPVFEDIDSEFELLYDQYSHVYVLSRSDVIETNDIVNTLGIENFEVEYKDRYLYANSPDDSTIGIYPKTFYEEKNIVLYEYDPNKIIFEINLSNSKIGVLNGVKRGDSIFSDGNAGIVMFGPYCSLSQGKYLFSMNVEIIKATSSDLGYFTIYVNNEKILLGDVPIKDYIIKEEGKSILRVPFELEADETSIEFVIKAEQNSLLKLNSYTIQKTK